jgi:hypothetical protein
MWPAIINEIIKPTIASKYWWSGDPWKLSELLYWYNNI